MFWNNYERILKELDREYKIPNNPYIKKREFDKVRLNPKTGNFLRIMKVLAEKGSCTISDIVKNDGLPIRKSRKSKKISRVDTYDRIIKGDGENISGLIKRWIIVEDKPILTSKPTKTYKLSLFGILYAIHIFSENGSPGATFYTEPKRREKYLLDDNFRLTPILDILAKHYSDSLPLIFGKWNFLKQEFFNMLNILVILAHGRELDNDELESRAIFNTRAFSLTAGWSNFQSPYADELTLWFFSLILLKIPFEQSRTILSRDKEIFDWYMKFLSNLSKAEKERSLRMKLHQHSLNGNQDLVKKTLKQISSIQGLEEQIVNDLSEV